MCPGKRNFCFFPVTFAKVLPLAVIFLFFCGYFCNFPTFFENFVSAWQTKSVWLPAPRIHLSPPLSLFSKYAPIVLQTPPLIVLHFQVLLSTPVWPTWPDRCSLTRDDNYSRTFHICKWWGGWKRLYFDDFLGQVPWVLVSHPEQCAREVKNVVKFSFLY